MIPFLLLLLFVFCVCVASDAERGSFIGDAVATISVFLGLLLLAMAFN